ncbi:MAG TPA: UrcA family protein [Sphingomicrobium sp.]
MRQTLLIIAGSALATAAVIKASPALSEPVQPQAIAIVQTGDLDLSSDRGQRQLSLRLMHAAHEVCDTASDVDLAGRNKAGQCRADVLARARATSAELAANGNATGEIRLIAAR